MAKRNKQAEAINHIRELLIQRGFDIPPRRITLPDNQQWLILERGGRQVGIDTASGIWMRETVNHEWRCVAMPHSISGALMAVEFLTTN